MYTQALALPENNTQIFKNENKKKYLFNTQQIYHVSSPNIFYKIFWLYEIVQ